MWSVDIEKSSEQVGKTKKNIVLLKTKTLPVECTAVIPALWETEPGGLQVWTLPGQPGNLAKLFPKIKRAGVLTSCVAQCEGPMYNPQCVCLE